MSSHIPAASRFRHPTMGQSGHFRTTYAIDLATSLVDRSERPLPIALALAGFAANKGLRQLQIECKKIL
jgi:hypothetical protein